MLPSADALMRRHEQLGIDLNWLLSGVGNMREMARSVATIPVKGFAECGIQGWFQVDPTNLSVDVSPGLVGKAGLIAVLTRGTSMMPAGINPGDVIFCGDGQPLAGDAVYVQAMDGAALPVMHIHNNIVNSGDDFHSIYNIDTS